MNRNNIVNPTQYSIYQRVIGVFGILNLIIYCLTVKFLNKFYYCKKRVKNNK